MRRTVGMAAGVCLAALGQAARAVAIEPPDLALLHYRQLQESRYAAQGAPIAEGGVEFAVDAAKFHLESGTIQTAESVNGVVTGFVFTGNGRFRFEVPNAFERVQLARFAKNAALESIDATLLTLIVRTVDPSVMRMINVPKAETYARHELVRERRALWLKDWGLDVDGRITAAELNTDDRFFIADVKTKEHGWLCVRFEPWEMEEVTLSKLSSSGAGEDTWVSLDQVSERAASGSPASDTRRLIDLTHAEIFADLADHRAELVIGFFEPPRPDRVKFRVRLDVEAREEVSALPFELHPLAELAEVRGSDGSRLAFLRDNFGKAYVGIADEESVASFVVLLDKPLRKGESRSLTFSYELRTLNYVGGRWWYPGPPDAFRDSHTTRATIVCAKRLHVRAVGALVSDVVEGNVRTSVWLADRPSKMYGFSFGAQFKEESIKLEGAPEVLVFGVSTGIVFGKMVRNVAVDVARSQKFFQDYFRLPPPGSVLRATAISGYHGQAFEGFLHLGQRTFNEEHPGWSERFRAHEVAHQYWGHLLGWKSYRDQWLSEAFSEYSALLFVESVLPKEKHFDLMIKLMVDSIAMRTPYERAEVGPIASGYRASTNRVPEGYFIQSYERGALVLHTMRTVMSSMSRDRDLFREMLGDFLEAYQGKDATTEDFLHFLEERVPYPWRPFFEEYVYGTDIPTFAWRWSPDAASGGKVVEVTIEASRVPKGFALAIPLAMDFGDGKLKYTFVQMDGAAKTFHIPVPVKPKRVALNPDNGVLARIERLK